MVDPALEDVELGRVVQRADGAVGDEERDEERAEERGARLVTELRRVSK